MTNLIFSVAIMAASFTSCSTNNSQPKEANAKEADSVPATTVSSTTDATTNQTTDSSAAKTGSVNEVVASYLQLKNALTKDNAKDAATAGKSLETAIQQIDVSAFTAEQKTMYAEVKEDIQEHAEHISTNAGKIAHQREHFEMLSTDMYDLVKAVKSSQPLYKDFCPMFNKGKGASWLSETEEIKNPYYGKQMLTCGSVKEELK